MFRYKRDKKVFKWLFKLHYRARNQGFDIVESVVAIGCVLMPPSRSVVLKDLHVLMAHYCVDKPDCWCCLCPS